MSRANAHLLPPASSGRTGWPWVSEGPAPAPAAGNGERWPRVSIVIPNYNQGAYIEEAIRSILLQGYPDLELIVMDGGSTDGTADVIRRYEPWLAHWVSEKDRGQSHAINKGMERATGAVCGWLCSDDWLCPGALGVVGRHFAQHPDCRWLSGAGLARRLPDGQETRYEAGRRGRWGFLAYWDYGGDGNCCPQPSTFWRRELWQEAGGLREDKHLAMDYDLWLRFEERARLDVAPVPLSVSRLRDDCKSTRFRREQGLEMMRIAYESCHRRGLAPARLTLAMLRWLPRHRLRWFARFLGQGWLCPAVGYLLSIPLDPFLVWREAYRLRIVRPRF